MHEGELALSERDVAALVARQHPRWAHLPVRAVASTGTVSALFRLGDDLVARFPLVPGPIEEDRRARTAEVDAARRLAAMTDVRTPHHLADGEPGPGCPSAWSIWTWLPGEPAGEYAAGSLDLARDLAAFVADLRRADTGGRRFTGERRGGQLAEHTGYVTDHLARGAHLIDVAPLLELWSRLVATPRREADVWTHGDLMPGNLLLRDTHLAAVIDVGGLSPADPALDLQPAWNLLAAGPRAVLRAELGCDDAQWARGRAWALAQASGCLWYYERTNPAMSQLAARTLAHVLESG